jgi:hypothetical protein
MHTNEIPADRASAVIEDLAAVRRPSLSVCNCGVYGFKSTVCPHHGVETAVKCGLALSKITNRPIFCPKKGPAPTFTFRDHVVAKPCNDYRRLHNAVSEGTNHLSGSQLQKNR